MDKALIFLIIFLTIPYFIVWLRNLIWDLYLWQVKEYRFDRLISQISFEKTKGVRNPLITYFSIGLFTLIFIFFLVGNIQNQLILIVIAFFVYWNESFIFLPKLITRKFFRPNIRSLRNLIIIALMIVVFILPYIWLMGSIPTTEHNIKVVNSDNFLSVSQVVDELTPVVKESLSIYRPEYLILFFTTIFGIGLDLFSPFLMALFILVTRPIAYFKRKSIISKAIVKISDHPKLRTVAVTGSYGKSTTKEIIYQILSQRFNTIKTEKNNNTDVGIASTVLKKLKKDTEIFVAEMGAYKIGEIEDCCKVVSPNIAIITGIDQQHLSLYGSIKAILDSSYEVIECLVPGGLTIFNGDNEYCIKLAEKTKTRKQFYFSSSNVEKLVSHKYEREKKDGNKTNSSSSHSLSVGDVKESRRGLQFKLQYDSKEYLLKTNLKVQYNISNLMAAILVAIELGLDVKEIVDIINKTEFQVPYLNVVEGINGVKVLDDGYNANFTGFIAALDYLKNLKSSGKKFVFTQGIIELGQEREKTYHELSKQILNNSDGVFTNDRDLYFALLNQNKNKLIKYIDSVFDFAVYYKTMVSEGDILLIEGPFPKAVLDKIYSKNIHD